MGSATMVGALIAIVIVLVIGYAMYRAVHKCHTGTGGIACKTWNWLSKIWDKIF
jgi:hypothetical protein